MNKGIPVSIFLILICFSFLSAQKERIFLDGLFEDWNNRTYSYTDKSGDGRFGYDFTNLKVENDENYIYFSFDTGIEINLQDNNDILLVIDTDNNYETGYPIDNLGADLIYAFGDRGGSFYKGNTRYTIYHDDVGLITLPTVSSQHFELALNRFSEIAGTSVFPGQEIKCLLIQDVTNGDKLPDQSGGVSFSFTETQLSPLPDYSIKKSSTIDFRLLSYNVLQDKIFDEEVRFRRQITGIDPDIIAFQEIYNHSAAQTRNLIENWLGGSWHSAKQGSDIIIISRYPILESYYVAGNGAFLLDVEGEEILLINAHLPCCDNDSGRQDEVDQIMAFLRNAKNGQSSLDLKDKTPVIIAGDMNFVGKNRQVKTFIEGDIQNEFVYGDDFHPDWDGTDYKDVLSFASNTPIAMTWYNTYSDYNPGRLDYIIYSDAVLKLENSFNLFTNSLPQDSLVSYSMLKNDTQLSSDHLPVVADFIIDYTNKTNELSFLKADLINAHPVPFSDQLILSLNENINQNSQIKVFGIDGQQVSSKIIHPGIGTLRINTSSWQNGSYILHIQSGNRIDSKVITKID